MSKWTWWGRAAALLALVAFWVPGARALEDPAERTRVTRLENGLVVLTLEDHTTPVVSFQMWVRVGSRDETRYTGLAHLFEHMMFKGSQNVPPEEHARLVNARGGRSNAWTNNDFTVYWEDVTAESLPLIIDLEHERVANLEVTAETLASEREVVLEERRMRTEDRPQGRAYEALFATTWQALPYRSPVIGWRSDVERATVEACQDFFDTYYSPNNIILSVVGDFDTEGTLARIRRSFGSLSPVESIPRNPTTEPPQKGERRSRVEFDLRAPVLTMAWHAPATGHDDSEALDVLGQVLSGGRSSRLYKSLVYEAELALGASGGYWEFQDAGLFVAGATVRPGESIGEVEALLIAELAAVGEQRVSPDELAKAKRQLEVALVRGLATNHAVGSRIARDFASFGRVRPLEDRLARIRAVSAEDVQRVARQYLRPEGRTVVEVVAPPSSPEVDS